MNETQGERVKLTFDDAVAMLPDGDNIHTFRSGPFMLIGADWGREPLTEAIRKYGAELSGQMATNMDHGLVLIDDRGPLFIETKKPA